MALVEGGEADWPNIPILLMSGYSTELYDGDTAGFDVLLKPYSAAVLSQALRRAFSANASPAGESEMEPVG